MTEAVVLLSGGIDSATCLAIACDKHDAVYPVHVQYGQQTADLELEMAECQRDYLAGHPEYVKTALSSVEVIDYESVFSHFAEGVAAEDKTFEHMTEDDGRSSGYVPMRNLHLIATAAAKADVLDAQFVYHGAQAGDSADYPDCRSVFMDSAAGAISKSLPDNQTIHLRTPLLGKKKPDVIETADRYGVEFAYTYSCYESASPEDPEPCGACPACEERIEAFREAGIEDPYMPDQT